METPQMTITQAFERYIASMVGVLSPATVTWYRGRLTPLLEFLGGDRVLDTLTLDELRAWRAALTERKTRWARHPYHVEVPGGLSRYTLQSHVRAARAFFKWCVNEELIAVSPARRLESPKLPDHPRKGIDEGDMLKIIEAAKRDPRDYAIVCFLASTGARVGGVAGLILGDLDLAAGRATVHEKGRGGNGKARSVFMLDWTLQAMRRWLATRPDVPGCDRVFLSHRSIGAPAPLGTSGIHQAIKRLARSVGVTKQYSPHQWRHAFARHMLASGANLAQVQQLMGHSDPSVTANFYGTFAVEELQQAHRRYALNLGAARG